ncbi:hypothetical protein PENTCL1PPCAC_21214, partial [Pristionchus entomophagus]
RRPEVADIQCDRIFKGDILYAKGLPRQVLIPTRPDRLDMSCEAVRKRVLSRRNPPTGFPIAFARVVYSDYEFLEEQLAVSYVDENTFCFALDRKAPLAFRRKFVTLSACLDNVHISSEEYELDSAGRGQTSAHFDCLRNIRKRKWKYVIFQQNHDIVIKTNAEIVEIFKTMGGANDMEMSMCPYDSRCSLHEMNLGRLGLCPKNLREKDREACEKEDITMAKGWAQVSLTRDTVEYLLDQLNTTRLISELHQMYYGMDELFIQSLASTRALRMPGMYPARCLYENNSVAPSNHLFVTRLTHWKWWKAYGCGSNIWRHNICIFGVEDLPYLAGVHHIMVNKLMPDVDYGAISCIGELLYNRTHYALDDHPLDLGIYENLPSVRLHKGMLDDPTYFDRFECPKFPQRKRKPMTQVIGEFL